MDKNTKHNTDMHSEVVNGPLTSKSYKTYSAIRDPKKRYNIRKIILCLVFAVLITTSAFIFITSIKTAYFNKNAETQPLENNLLKTRSEYDTNNFIKVETVTKDISEVFGIPTGVKIVEISEHSLASLGLKINDIIVNVSGTSISNIDEFNKVVDNISPDEFISYTVYRNGNYQTVNPYEIEYEE